MKVWTLPVFIVFLLSGLNAGCVKEAVVRSGKIDREPVLMARFTGHMDDTSAVRLTWSTTAEAGSVEIPEDARVAYYLDGQIVGEARPDKDGYCEIPRNFPRSGQAFTVEAHVPGLAPVTATDTMPYGSPVLEASFRPAGFYDEEETYVQSAKVKLYDPPGVRNYYEMSFFQAYDGGASYFFITFEADAVIKNEGDLEFEPMTYFFSDELFDGQIVEIEILLRGYVASGERLDHRPFYLLEDGHYLLFRTISRNWYDYLKAYTRHRYTRLVGQGLSGGTTFQDLQNLLFAPEPTPMFSNVENGLGAVAGAHTQIIKMDE